MTDLKANPAPIKEDPQLWCSVNFPGSSDHPPHGARDSDTPADGDDGDGPTRHRPFSHREHSVTLQPTTSVSRQTICV